MVLRALTANHVAKGNQPFLAKRDLNIYWKDSNSFLIWIFLQIIQNFLSRKGITFIRYAGDQNIGIPNLNYVIKIFKFPDVAKNNAYVPK